MRISIKNKNINLKLSQHLICKIKYIAKEAMEYVKCGGKNAICGTFTCSQEVYVTKTEVKGGEDNAI